MSPASTRPTGPRLAAAAPLGVVVVGAGDPDASRLVYAMVIGLVVVGLALALLGVWILRQTRPDLEVLAPLERMGDGDWKKRDRSTQRRMLDELRPDGAQPLTPEPMPPPIDAEFEADQPVSSFSDLGPGVASEQRGPTPDVLDPPEELDAPGELDPPDDQAPVDPAPPAPLAAPVVAHDDEALSDPRG